MDWREISEKKVMKLLYTFIIFSAFFGCQSLQKTSEVDKIFSENEKRDLLKMVDFFKTEMCENDTTFKACFESILPNLLNNGINPVLEKIEFKSQINLYENFESKVFDDIWIFTKQSFAQNLEKKYKSLAFNPNGNYRSFLKSLSKRNKGLKYYYDTILSSGDFPNNLELQGMIYQKPEYFNLDDINIQVLIVVHFLSNNDNEKRLEPWVD